MKKHIQRCDVSDFHFLEFKNEQGTKKKKTGEYIWVATFYLIFLSKEVKKKKHKNYYIYIHYGLVEERIF